MIAIFETGGQVWIAEKEQIVDTGNETQIVSEQFLDFDGEKMPLSEALEALMIANETLPCLLAVTTGD